MIPTLLLVGLVLGRWWRVVIPLATVGWPVLLIVTGVDSGLDFGVAAGLLAVANVGIGVLLNQVVRRLVRLVTTANPR